jgi:hypothetical protein
MEGNILVAASYIRQMSLVVAVIYIAPVYMIKKTIIIMPKRRGMMQIIPHK